MSDPSQSSSGTSLGESGDLTTEALLAALTGDDPTHLAVRARGGHSPSARALVNASDLVSSLALAAAPAEPSEDLRARVLATASSIHGARPILPAAPAQAPAILAPCEMIAQLHEADADDVVRRERIVTHGVAGVVGGVAEAVDDDAEIAALLARMAPFVEPSALFVSVVRAGQTIHRVHRGFPTEFGNVDIVPRQTSFCTHCVSGDAPLVVHDAAAEAFFRSAVVVQSFSARTYVGIPLRVSGASADASSQSSSRVGVGALCSIGFFRPRRVSPAELEFFGLFAVHAEAIVAKDRAARDRIHAGGLYDAAFFDRLLALEIARAPRERIAAPTLVVIPWSNRAAVTHDDLAARISDAEIGVLIGGEGRGESAARVGAKTVVPLSSDIASAAVWLEMARA